MSETYFVKQHKKDNFTILDNTCIRDKRLSWKAKGFHTYLMSLPDDWKIHVSEIVNHSCDGKSALYSAIKMLEDYGYLKKIRNRRKDGCFESTVYKVFEQSEINDESVKSYPLSDSLEVDNRDVDNPISENPPLLTTNKLNTDKQRTELTNSVQPKSENGQSVSESVFSNIIKGLFGGEYSFDKNFEGDVTKKLSAAEITEQNLEAYLQYVFERTKVGNVQKSFEGLYRTLALSSSIIRDFKNSSFINKDQPVENEVKRKIKYVTCPVCKTQFDELDSYCPLCGLAVRDMGDETNVEFIAKKKVFEMSDSERQVYETAFQNRFEEIRARTGRPFLLENEKIQFWKEYGILN